MLTLRRPRLPRPGLFRRRSIITICVWFCARRILHPNFFQKDKDKDLRSDLLALRSFDWTCLQRSPITPWVADHLDLARARNYWWRPAKLSKKAATCALVALQSPFRDVPKHCSCFLLAFAECLRASFSAQGSKTTRLQDYTSRPHPRACVNPPARAQQSLVLRTSHAHGGGSPAEDYISLLPPAESTQGTGFH